MNWLRKIFGSPKRYVASSSLTLDEAWKYGMMIAVQSSGNHDLDVARPTNTNSMVPAMDENCIILVETVPFEALTLGDIVLYQANPALWSGVAGTICHRIVEKTRNGWWTLGDGNGRMDPEYVTPANYSGKRVAGILYTRRTSETDK